MATAPAPSNRPTAPRLPAGGGRDPYAHSKAVRVARVALPAVAGVVLLTIFVWPLLFGGSSDNSRPGPAQGDLELTQARYLGTDTGDQPFEIRAERAAQQGGGRSLVDLSVPQADITLKRGTWLSMAAATGTYDQDNQLLSLAGPVSLFHGSGYELRTREAVLDVKKGIAWGNKPVEGQGPMGTVEAGGFRVLDDGDVLVFTGQARLRAFGANGPGKANQTNDKPGETAP